MHTKRIILTLITVITAMSAFSQRFSDFFTDETLRLDYVFAGNSHEQHIYLDKLCRSPHWYGKHSHLAELPVEGNGQVIVRDKTSGTVIYRNSFSTLFQEWITYDEAQSTSRSFENVFLVPMPKQPVTVTVQLMSNRREPSVSFTHDVDPTDILIHSIGHDGITPYVTLQQSADAEKSVKVAFVAEGYTKEEMATFLTDCRKAMDAMFRHEPFKSYRRDFNIVAVKSASKDSGTSEPGNGIWKNTVLGSHFNTFYSDRYLTTLNLKALHDVLAGIPYEHIIVLVNTSKYGGGGILNSYNLSMTHHPQYEKVVVHEFGHSFAGLADEYAYESEPLEMYPADIEPWEPNITTRVDFTSKWQDLMGQQGVGLHEGAGYQLKGCYRPCQDCRMRSNDTPEFCPVCQRALRKLIDFYTQ